MVLRNKNRYNSSFGFCATKTVTTAIISNVDNCYSNYFAWCHTHAMITFIVRSCNSYFQCLYFMFCISGTTTQHPLMAKAMDLAQNSVMLSSQKSYRSLWNKWEIFLHKYFPPVWTVLIRTIKLCYRSTLITRSYQEYVYQSLRLSYYNILQ